MLRKCSATSAVGVREDQHVAESSASNPSSVVAATVLDELRRHGVRDVVLAPGSRSAPFAFAAHAADRAGTLRLHVRIDERSAGFLALGIAKSSRRTVAVVTTSGTAVANLHPAVLESSHARVPLIVLSADRPTELRGTGSNQTTDQVKLFGDAVRLYAELPPERTLPDQPAAASSLGAAIRSTVSRCVARARGALGSAPGPVHLNVAFREPLVPGSDAVGPLPGRADEAPWTVVADSQPGEPVTLPLGSRTVVVAGDDAGPPLRILAQNADWPLLAEPSSGSRAGGHPIGAYRMLLDHPPLADRIERVIVGGHPTLSRPVSRLLARDDVELIVVARGDYPDPGHRAARVVRSATVERPEDPTWLGEWRAADQLAKEVIDKILATEPGLTPYAVAQAVSASVPAGGLLFVGSSNPIRDLDLMAVSPTPGEHRLVLANRGLSGIDGVVSAAIGAALGRPSTKALAYVGDLTFLHDSNGLVIGPDEPRPDLTIVVASDDGGSIFALLEQGDDAYAESFERVFGTRTGVEIGVLCAAVGLDHVLVKDELALRRELESSPPGIRVVEARVDRRDRRALDARLRSNVLEALRG
jgi:2-succinyl-5-enolpyruvyl-6-hydroxy-3-cyclohexene-1-carboxylate synthase